MKLFKTKRNKRYGRRACGLLFATTLALSSLLLYGCGKDDDVQRYAWALATASPEDTVTQLFAEKVAEEVDRLSDLLESCADGDIPFVVQNTAPQVSFMQDLAVFDLPCVFDSLDQCRDKIDDPTFYGLISDVYTDGGYHLLGMADQGFRVMSTNKKVSDFSDFKGQKIRTMENSYHLAFWKSIGASPTPMSFSEVYIGLQQHTIDAQENPYEVIVSNNLYEQQDYIVETNHLPHLISLIVNDEFYQDLTPDQQKIMTQAAQTATAYAREQSDERIADKIAVIEDSGTEIITLSDETRAQIRQASQSVYDSIKKTIHTDIYNAYLDN